MKGSRTVASAPRESGTNSTPEALSGSGNRDRKKVTARWGLQRAAGCGVWSSSPGVPLGVQRPCAPSSELRRPPWVPLRGGAGFRETPTWERWEKPNSGPTFQFVN